ncbi:hypothetical protein TNCV_4190351 [Trichonephila clavipes]|nr:hypothetical protein TNCV_4190351 [Trichonephila clavipes]
MGGGAALGTWKLWRCRLWPHLVVTTRYQDPSFGERVRRIVGSLNRHMNSFHIASCSNGLRRSFPFFDAFPVDRKASIHIKAHFRSKGTRLRGGISKKRRKALRTATANRPFEKYASTANVPCGLDHDMFETEMDRNTNIPLHPFHRTPPYELHLVYRVY